MTKLEKALKEAKVIRKELQSLGEYPKNLGGACGHAAAILCYRLKDARALRGGDFVSNNQSGGHWWTEIQGFIVDPTATQFLRKVKAVHSEPIPSKRYREDNCKLSEHWSFVEDNYEDMSDVKIACQWAKKELRNVKKRQKRRIISK